MIITDLLKLSLCTDDFVLLDRMAGAAGKNRDVFVTDVLHHMLTIERELSRDARPSGVGG